MWNSEENVIFHGMFTGFMITFLKETPPAPKGIVMDLRSQNTPTALPPVDKRGPLLQSIKKDADIQQKRRQAIAALKAIGDLYPLNPGSGGIAGLLARGRR